MTPETIYRDLQQLAKFVTELADERDAAIKRAEEAKEQRDCAVANNAEWERRYQKLDAENEKLRGELGEAWESQHQWETKARRLQASAEKTAREQREAAAKIADADSCWGTAVRLRQMPLVTDAPSKPHPQYGPCDAFGPGGSCSECTGVVSPLSNKLDPDAPSKPEEVLCRKCGLRHTSSTYDHAFDPAPPPESPAEPRCKHGHYCTGGDHE